jgi:hypothetical protein
MKTKEKCVWYLGDRGIDRQIKRCDEYKNMWFIVFKDYPEDVEVSFKSDIYECYDEISTTKMKWNKSNYEKIRKQLNILSVKGVIYTHYKNKQLKRKNKYR